MAAATGGYESPEAFTDGVKAALPIAVAVLAGGAMLALLTPRRTEPGSATAEADALAAAPGG